MDEPKANDSKKACGVVDSQSVVYGEFIAGGTVCKESAINNVVARVHLDSLKCDDFIVNNGKGLKRKLEEPAAQDVTNGGVVESPIKKKGRGRPRKIQPGVTVPTSPPPRVALHIAEGIPLKKRGRPRKNPEEPTDLQIIKLKQNLLKVKRLKRLNGDKSTIMTSARVRKPNSRFQDFVVSPTVRYFAPSRSESPVEKSEKIPIKVRPKPKPSPPKEDEDAGEDPLAISGSSGVGSANDVVRSFLPVFDDPPRIDKVLLVKNADTIRQSLKEKENRVNNVQPKVRKSISSSDDSDYSPPKLHRTNPDLSTTVTKSPKVRTYSNKALQPKQALITDVSKPKSPIVDATKTNLKPIKHSITKISPSLFRGKTKINGSNSPIKKKDVQYVLVSSDDSPNRTKSSKPGDVDFNKLVRSLKSVKLPAANWKIRIVVSKQQTITEVTFTNKEVNERCVKFSRVFAGYIITFGKSTVSLLGAPLKISSFNDVTILLDIVHNVSSSDPVLDYGTD